MNYASPLWFYLLPVVIIVLAALYFYESRSKKHHLQRFASARLLPVLTMGASQIAVWTKALLLVMATAMILWALSRPQFGIETIDQKGRGLDIVFVIDSSKSMLATDLRPTRLDRAKLAVFDLLDRLESDRVGLVSFAGSAFLQTPPTLDYSAFRESLDAVSPQSFTQGGSDIGLALREAAGAFPTDINEKIVLLLTDGEDLGGRAIEAAKEAKDEGIKIFTIGLGTPEGDYLRVLADDGEEAFMRDQSGQPVRSKLDEGALQEIAVLTGGQYVRLGAVGLGNLYDTILSILPKEERNSEVKEVPVERFQWFLWLAILFLVFETIIRTGRRIRGTMTVAVLALLFTTTHSDLDAADESPNNARELFENATEKLTSSSYQEAAELYEQVVANTDDLGVQAKALYNQAHLKNQLARTLYQSGNLPAALEQAESSLSLFESLSAFPEKPNTLTEDIEAMQKTVDAIRAAAPEEQENESSESNENSDGEESEDGEQSDQENERSESSDSGSEQDQSESEQKEDSDQSDSENESGESEEEPSDNSDGESSEETEDSQNQQNEASNASSEESGEEQEQETSDAGEDGEPSEEQQEAEAQSENDQAEDVSEQPQSMTENADGQENGDGEQAPQTIVIEGMSPQDAAQLLDSLKSEETLLPFNQRPNGQRGFQKDW